MIRSMTGYGRFELLKDEKRFEAELKSVNHKYFDVNIRIPRFLSSLETKIKSLLCEYASRGKIDIFITYENLSTGLKTLRYNSDLAEEYLSYYREIGSSFGLVNDVSVYSLARSPEVLTLEELKTDENELWNVLEEVLKNAFSAFRISREREGESLKSDILIKLDDMTENVDFIEKRAPDIIKEYKSKLIDRVKDLLEAGHIDDSRIAAEVTIFADKTAIDEEIVRLKAHISHMRNVLESGGNVGRNLDFIAQEMNREANTILSKSNDIEITNCGIELKTCIEKIREQVQNIE